MNVRPSVLCPTGLQHGAPLNGVTTPRSILRRLSMWSRALLVWFSLLAAAFANGAVRELWLVRSVGEGTAHVISAAVLSLAILVVTWPTISWMQPRSPSDAWRIGALWLALTLTFEFLAGHYLFGAPWSRLWADYNISSGRIWVLVPITTVAAPVIAARTRDLFSSGPQRDIPR